eukprot:Filipodium_phascolosomae@DN7258_c0_g1_i1.p1
MDMVCRSNLRLAILKIRPFHTREELKKAYAAAARKYHPDHNSEPNAAQNFHQLNQEYKQALERLNAQESQFQKQKRSRFPRIDWSGLSSRVVDWLVHPTIDLFSYRLVMSTWATAMLLTLHFYTSTSRNQKEREISNQISGAERELKTLQMAVHGKAAEVAVLQQKAKRLGLKLTT